MAQTCSRVCCENSPLHASLSHASCFITSLYLYTAMHCNLNIKRRILLYPHNIDTHIYDCTAIYFNSWCINYRSTALGYFLQPYANFLSSAVAPLCLRTPQHHSQVPTPTPPTPLLVLACISYTRGRTGGSHFVVRYIGNAGGMNVDVEITVQVGPNLL